MRVTSRTRTQRRAPSRARQPEHAPTPSPTQHACPSPSPMSTAPQFALHASALTHVDPPPLPTAPSHAPSPALPRRFCRPHTRHASPCLPTAHTTRRRPHTRHASRCRLLRRPHISRTLTRRSCPLAPQLASHSHPQAQAHPHSHPRFTFTLLSTSPSLLCSHTSQLRQSFEPFGTVLRAEMTVDKDTGQSKGYGFVSYTTVEAADAAMAQMNGSLVGDKQIRIEKTTT